MDFIVLVIGFSILKEDDLSYSAWLLDDFQSHCLCFVDIQIRCFPPCLGNFFVNNVSRTPQLTSVSFGML